MWERAWLGALGGRTLADVQQDTAAGETPGCSYLDGCRHCEKKTSFHIGVDVRVPGVSCEDLLLARENSPE